MNNFHKFKELHTGNSPLFIGNAWDVQSAIMLENSGYKAIGTSSAAIAASLGYEDGEVMSFDEHFSVIKAIKGKSSLPLTVDLEAGYSRDPNIIFTNIVSLNELGVVGVNLEDSIVESGNRRMVDANEFSKLIEFIANNLAKKRIEIFINIRTDAYFMGLDNALENTMVRSKLYEKAGADGLFIPCATDEKDIKAVIENASIPINVMATPNLPEFSILQQLGVRRISSGPFLYTTVNKCFNDLLQAIDIHQSFNPVFEGQR